MSAPEGSKKLLYDRNWDIREWIKRMSASMYSNRNKNPPSSTGLITKWLYDTHWTRVWNEPPFRPERGVTRIRRRRCGFWLKKNNWKSTDTTKTILRFSRKTQCWKLFKNYNFCDWFFFGQANKIGSLDTFSCRTRPTIDKIKLIIHVLMKYGTSFILPYKSDCFL